MPFTEGNSLYQHPNSVATRFKVGRVSPRKGTGVSKAEHDRRYYIKNRELLLAKARARNAIKKKEYSETKRIWAENNKEKSRAIKRAWRLRNQAVVQSWDAARRARMRNAVVADADEIQIEKFYALAARLTLETGVLYTVDHIKPLALGGTHHQDNLQVITMIENSRKGAKFPFFVAEQHLPRAI